MKTAVANGTINQTKPNRVEMTLTQSINSQAISSFDSRRSCVAFYCHRLFTITKRGFLTRKLVPAVFNAFREPPQLFRAPHRAVALSDRKLRVERSRLRGANGEVPIRADLNIPKNN
jgi:hypothetical protein